MILHLQAHQLQTPAMAVVRPPSSTFSLTVPLGVSKHFSPHNVQTHSGLSSNTFSAVSHFIPNAFHLHLPSKLVQSSLRRQSTKPIHHSLPQKQSSLSPLVGAGFSLALLASTATIAGGTPFAADFPLMGSSSLQLSEPQNALSPPTRAIHVSSVIEWITAMALVWKYGERPVYDSWKGLSWGMNRKITLEVLPSQNDCGDMDTNSVEFSSNSQDCKDSSFSDASAFEISFRSWLKFLMLMGFFTLQGSHQAVAGSGFAAGLPSVPDLGDLGDINTGFASAFLLIFFSELGDKTFFIAALLAARNSGAIIFVGTFGALAAMSIISVVIGRTFHYVDDILPFRFGETDLPIDDIAAVGLLTYFGVSTLIEAASNDGPKAEEEQKEAELAVSEFSGNGAGILAAASTVISTFVLVFVAEWGDKSFFSTIALAAASSPLGVIGGAVAGHAVATLLAVLGGSLLGTFLSEKVIAYVGGTLFLVLAAVTLVEIVT